MFKKTLIAAALAVAATGSFAQAYVQGAIGQGTINPEVAGATIKKTSTGNKFAVGYSLGNGWAVEGMLISFGKAVATTSTGTTADAKATSTAIGGVYNADLGGGHGLKLGLYYGANKLDISGSAVTAGNAGSETKNKVNYGLGYAYNFNKATALTVDYDAAGGFVQEKVLTGKTTRASLLSVGVRFSF